MLVKRAQGKSAMGRINWRSRFFVLTKESLSYYEKPEGACKGTIDLSTVKAVEHVADATFSKPGVFQVGYSEYILYIECHSQEERESWVREIRQQVARNLALNRAYHPGVFDSKWTCCQNPNRDYEGCKACFDYQ